MRACKKTFESYKIDLFFSEKSMESIPRTKLAYKKQMLNGIRLMEYDFWEFGIIIDRQTELVESENISVECWKIQTCMNIEFTHESYEKIAEKGYLNAKEMIWQPPKKWHFQINYWWCHGYEWIALDENFD